ncbi:tetratricopeptide repeat protein [Sulfidibacter corallicola]|uniref:Tetratricopeptide repeat protein n=1 Tax=Sulfidibacter corallicola TaxID=2818388 RepID=A0A8A4U3F4_SULCO|nr:tetratricopeptide repeat protein [Sulfidibacter corallicola]QTD53275.1 tetratricopeptide repeat protein [Sulfidibacter corallicola]
MKQGKFQEAIVLLDESIASYPDWYFPILLKGQANMKLKKFDVALRNFNDALTLEIPTKDIPGVKYSIVQCYMSLKDYNKAIHAIDDLMPLVPASRKFDLLLNRGQSEMQIAKSSEGSGNNKKAQTFYSKAIVSFTEALKAPVGKKNHEIEAAFQKAYAQYKIGNAKGGIQSLEKSIKAFEDVIERNKREERAHKFLIDLSFRVAQSSAKSRQPTRYQETVSYIDRYLSIWPNKPEMMNKKGAALQGAKKYREAVEVFKLVTKLLPKDGTVYFSLGSCQMAAKQFAEAIGSFQKAIANGEKGNHNIYSFIAYCYQEQKQGCYNTDIPLYTNAVKILEQGVKNVSGQGKGKIQGDLQRKKDNLNILEENKSTDNSNHMAAITNVTKLERSIDANRDKLQRNQELYIRQPTEELRLAIEEGKKAIREDEGSMQNELEVLRRYVRESGKCGGQGTFDNYDKMREVIKRHGSGS